MRIRKHTDGRIAVERVDEAWSVHDGSDPRWPAVRTAHTDDVIGEGWVELYTAVLPEPDQVGDESSLRWITYNGKRLTVFADGIHFRELDGVEGIYQRENIDALRAGALKTLAAIVAFDAAEAAEGDHR
jgi:hypothetical protein